jgi:tRNA uridine 5-carboxymethylaminomethyl modification enzyme
VNKFLEEYQSSPLTTGAKLAELLRRTELKYEDLKQIDKKREELPKDVKEEVEIEIKYKGYIKLQQQQVEKFKKLERKLLPQEINYEEIKGLRLEARQKLNKIKPNSVGQASRISGVSPADISVLLIYLEQQKS